MSLTFQLGISSADAVILRPEFDYQGGRRQIASSHRTKAGRLYRYTWGDYERFQFTLDFVPASDAALVNSWWSTDTELLFFVSSDTATEVHSVMITAKQTPLRRFRAPYADLYKGKILLEGY